MKEFLIQNWKLILFLILGAIVSIPEIVLALLGIIINIFKKDNNVRQFILENIPVLIKRAEELYKDGAKKKDYVLQSMEELIKSTFPNALTSIYKGYIRSAVEEILSCPQKKGYLL